MRARIVLASAVMVGFLVPLLAEEGMWLPNRVPRAQIKAQYGFDVTDDWLAHVQQAAVRFNNGGSAAFVSANGLIATNHHVGRDCIGVLSTPTRNLLQNGFLARTAKDELACPGLEINVLVSIEDVTARIAQAVTPEMTPAAANSARLAAIAAVEKASTEATRLRSDVVTLYQGGRVPPVPVQEVYGRPTGVRPRGERGVFGGDTDNFEFPRYNLDISFFRAYQDGRPVHTEHFLQFDAGGVKEGDLVFLAGHPGSTQRMNSVAHLLLERDVHLPDMLNVLRRRELVIGAYARRSPEHARHADDQLKQFENSRKAMAGYLRALQDPILLAAKRRDEDALRANAPGGPAGPVDPWQMIERAVERDRAMSPERRLLANGQAFHSELFRMARTLARYTDEVGKPNGERLREFRDSNLESLRHELLADVPVHPGLDVVTLADSLSYWMERMPQDPLLLSVLDGNSPHARAMQLVSTTRLADPARRRALLEGATTREADTDPMIAVARLVDARARQLRHEYESGVQEPLRQAYAAIARRRFERDGAAVYPDATFTLRLAYGTVKGNTAADPAPWTTRLGGIFERADMQGQVGAFALPESWRRVASQLDKATPFNFVSTTDMIGGNSGSPVIDRSGHWVGIAFDGNVHMLGWNYAYANPEARAINVHAAAVAEALRVVYTARELLDELGVTSVSSRASGGGR